jgi:DNA (cytosine-5)-methyltransferase 1
MKTCYTLFAGGGGKTLGAIAAGYQPIGAIDYWEPACEHYRRNIGPHIECADLLKTNLPDCKGIDLLMASPPCPSFSRANVGGKETMIDYFLSAKIAEVTKAWRPKAILIENVPEYARSTSFIDLRTALAKYGYQVWCGVLNSADYGVPQTRRRLYLVATKGKLKFIPPNPTHSQTKQALPKWVGWYDSISDLIPAMKDSALTARQISAIEKDGSYLIERIGYYGGVPSAWPVNSPIGTIRSSLAADGRGNKREKYWTCWLGNEGRAKDMNTRAMARLQGFPDSTEWSGDCRTDIRIIGNSVIPLMAQKLLLGLL